jgi:hypothetical protein
MIIAGAAKPEVGKPGPEVPLRLRYDFNLKEPIYSDWHWLAASVAT